MTRKQPERRVFVVQWDASAAAARAKELRDHGWTVAIESADGGAAYRRVREKPPAVLLVDLSVKPSHGRATAESIRQTKLGRTLPILFVGGTAKDRAAVKRVVPDARFCDAAAARALDALWEELAKRSAQDNDDE